MLARCMHNRWYPTNHKGHSGGRNKASIADSGSGIQANMGKTQIFDEKYRVVGVERDRLLLRGVLSGDVLTVLNSEPEVPLTQEEYPLGKLIALTDPSNAPLN
jgi:hypothetical protein